MLVRVFLQDEVRKGHPYSIPGKVVSIHPNGHSVSIWCPCKNKRLLRNHRKMRLQVNDDDDDEGDDETYLDEAEMTDEEEIDLVDDESHELLTALARVPTVTQGQIRSKQRQESSRLSGGPLRLNGLNGLNKNIPRFRRPAFVSLEVFLGVSRSLGIFRTRRYPLSHPLHQVIKKKYEHQFQHQNPITANTVIYDTHTHCNPVATWTCNMAAM